MEKFERFYVSQVGVLIRDNKCLILEFSKYPGKWGLPGGRVDEGELGENAFRRELLEEIGFDDVNIHALLDYDIFYTESKKAYCAIVQFIENNDSEIILSEEHSSLRWVGLDELSEYDFMWKNLPRMIKKGFDYYKKLN